MNKQIRQYLFGLIFFGVGVYKLTGKEYSEASLYCLAGLAFVFNALVSEPRLESAKRIIVIITWGLIIITAVLFLYLLQSRYL